MVRAAAAVLAALSVAAGWGGDLGYGPDSQPPSVVQLAPTVTTLPVATTTTTVTFLPTAPVTTTTTIAKTTRGKTARIASPWPAATTTTTTMPPPTTITTTTTTTLPAWVQDQQEKPKVGTWSSSSGRGPCYLLDGDQQYAKVKPDKMSPWEFRLYPDCSNRAGYLASYIDGDGRNYMETLKIEVIHEKGCRTERYIWNEGRQARASDGEDRAREQFKEDHPSRRATGFSIQMNLMDPWVEEHSESYLRIGSGTTFTVLYSSSLRPRYYGYPFFLEFRCRDIPVWPGRTLPDDTVCRETYVHQRDSSGVLRPSPFPDDMRDCLLSREGTVWEASTGPCYRPPVVHMTGWWADTCRDPYWGQHIRAGGTCDSGKQVRLDLPWEQQGHERVFWIGFDVREEMNIGGRFLVVAAGPASIPEKIFWLPLRCQ